MKKHLIPISVIKNLSYFIILFTITIAGSCSKNNNPPAPVPTPPTTTPGVSIEAVSWITTPDKIALLQLQPTNLIFGTAANSNENILVDSAQTFQNIDGFGYTLTGGSARLINTLPAANRNTLLQELFSTQNNGIGISYLRVSIGASDLSDNVFTYNDMPAGQSDANLTNFNLAEDSTHLVPLLQQILQINPNIKILGSPWTPPVWMKDNQNSKGGSLLPAYYASYANYFVKYIKAMKAKGITIDAITIQNEPENPDNNPSMLMTATEQANFIKNNLGPAFQQNNLTTKIILFDHNCDHPNYPIAVLNDAAAKPFINGSAFHLYLGDISALSTVRAAHPDKNIYFTEQWTSSAGDFGGDLKWHLKNVIIGSMRNWSKNALEWNLANDASFGPHTPGGCTQCKGALTINGTNIEKNVAYYIIAHASKFVPMGSQRISSSLGTVPNVAFLRADGKKVVIALNESGAAKTFNIRFKDKWIVCTLAAGAVGTYIW